MDFALALGIYLVGVISGALVAIAVMSDKPRHDLHSGPDDLERRARRYGQ